MHLMFLDCLFSKYTNPGTATFLAPVGVTTVAVLVVGGGGGSGYPDSAAGSGKIKSLTLNVTPGMSYNIVVGAGGKGAAWEIDPQDGDASSFGGSMLSADGGKHSLSYQKGAGSGGSGGGAGYMYGKCLGGGRGGRNGKAGSNCERFNGGEGQGEAEWNTFLSPFKYNTLTAGNGGAAGYCGEPATAGGGGGGVLFNGQGGNAASGSVACRGEGGAGYGGGGGAGGYDKQTKGIGGRGSDGLVYIEWKKPVYGIA